MLNEEESFRQALQERKEFFRAVNDKSARQTTQHLFVNYTVNMRVVPEQAGALALVRRYAYFILKIIVGMNMDEHVVAIPFWRHAHSVEMQVTGIAGQAVPKPDSHDVARSNPKHWRQVRPVIKKSRK